MRLRIGLHPSGYYRIGLGIPGGIPSRRPVICPEPPGGLEIQLKKGLICGKVKKE